MSIDPWVELKRPPSTDAVTARRVDPEHRWGFFWIRDSINRKGLLLQCSVDSAESADPPALHGISIGFMPDPGPGRTGALVLRLNESENGDVFHALCLDMVAQAANAATERDAVLAIVQRAWRWHYLLRKGRDSRLSIEEQKGLMGELLFLDEVLMDRFGVGPAVDAWKGPLGSAKDFVVGAVAVEIKASRNAGGPVVRISSEFQLDETDLAALFLGVVDVMSGDHGETEAATLSEMVARVEDRVAHDTDVLMQFHMRLLAVGYRKEDPYPEQWSAGKIQLHKVHGDFPRLTPSTIPSAVTALRYHLPVPALRAFQVETATFIDAVELQGSNHDR